MIEKTLVNFDCLHFQVDTCLFYFYCFHRIASPYYLEQVNADKNQRVAYEDRDSRLE